MFCRGGGIQPWETPPASSLRLDDLPVEINNRRLPLSSIPASRDIAGVTEALVPGVEPTKGSKARKADTPIHLNTIQPQRMKATTGEAHQAHPVDRHVLLRPAAHGVPKTGCVAQSFVGAKYRPGINMQPPASGWRYAGGPSLAGFRHLPSRSDESRPTTMPLPWRPHTVAPQRLGADCEIKIKGWPGSFSSRLEWL